MVMWLAVIAALTLGLAPASAAPRQDLPPGDPSAYSGSLTQVMVNGTVTVDDGQGDVSTMALPTGVHTFTRASPGASFSDAQGTLTFQINYNTSPRQMQWAYTMNPALCGLANGPAVHTQNLSRAGVPLPYHYYKGGTSPCYFYHSSWASTYLNTGYNYQTTGLVVFPIPNGQAKVAYTLNWRLDL